MAGMILFGCPLICGFVGAPFVQAVMRSYGMSMSERFSHEATMVICGAVAIALKPLPSPPCKKFAGWGWFMLFGSLVSLGVWTMADGIVINLGSGLYGLLRGS